MGGIRRGRRRLLLVAATVVAAVPAASIAATPKGSVPAEGVVLLHHDEPSVEEVMSFMLLQTGGTRSVVEHEDTWRMVSDTEEPLELRIRWELMSKNKEDTNPWKVQRTQGKGMDNWVVQHKFGKGPAVNRWAYNFERITLAPRPTTSARATTTSIATPAATTAPPAPAPATTLPVTSTTSVTRTYAVEIEAAPAAPTPAASEETSLARTSAEPSAEPALLGEAEVLLGHRLAYISQFLGLLPEPSEGADGSGSTDARVNHLEQLLNIEPTTAEDGQEVTTADRVSRIEQFLGLFSDQSVAEIAAASEVASKMASQEQSLEERQLKRLEDMLGLESLSEDSNSTPAPDVRVHNIEEFLGLDDKEADQAQPSVEERLKLIEKNLNLTPL